MKHPTQVETPRWDAVYLVCKACGKRDSVPKDARPKVVAAIAKQRSKVERPRARVVFTSCLGLCPKGATAVARVGGDAPARLAAIRSSDDFDVAFPVRAPATTDDRTPDA